MDIPAILAHIRPGETWQLDGDALTGLVWHSKTNPPTTTEVEAAWPEVQNARALVVLRRERDALLAASDWTQVADAACDKVAWAKYRQALRDLPAKTDEPADPKWPAAPK